MSCQFICMLDDDTLFGFRIFLILGATTLRRRYVVQRVRCCKVKEHWRMFGIGRHGLKVAGLAVNLQLPEPGEVD
ncbi:hypothetical protein BA896_012250 [Janthinobacterium lividum]|uniref:Uncharacterized protein n=1 Tax=Janthinobacterium lividum TaxID=29581 RepID=A0A1E8PV61_9BURK|nr:hypothetical protein BA896_012250 [Janthinobacterium lividum]